MLINWFYGEVLIQVKGSLKRLNSVLNYFQQKLDIKVTQCHMTSSHLICFLDFYFFFP